MPHNDHAASLRRPRSARVRYRSFTIWWVALATTLFALPAAAHAVSPIPDGPTLVGEDEVIPHSSDFDPFSLQASDPLGLFPGVDVVRQHSLGTDVIDVWACGIGDSPQTLVAELDATVAPYFTTHSRGRLDIEFVARGTGPANLDGCYERAYLDPSREANGALLLLPTTEISGGLGGPGMGESFPDNGRFAVVGYSAAYLTITAHEMGHMFSWPHSFTMGVLDRRSPSGFFEYDNALDLMSGNYGVAAEGAYGTNAHPYDTAVINRYAAGWIDASEVVVAGPGESTFTLHPSTGTGTQMAVVSAGDVYFTLGARTTSEYDPIPEIWNGVEVYEVTPCPEQDVLNCLADSRFDMGFRQHRPLGLVAFDPDDRDDYDRPLGHVIQPGSAKVVGCGRTVSVAVGTEGSYEVSVSEGSFCDIAGSIFTSDIAWLAEGRITKGCNPPLNDLFCPDEPVTRGQMAAFLHRALPGLDMGTSSDFGDDDDSVFEADIEWLSASGVTKGCNPPANSMFCPEDLVTRGQMAAFLHRALPTLPQTGDAMDFRDVDGITFEADIEWLAATGVTKGCNPPANDRFCPGEPVTRGAMAAFLHRALAD